MRRFQSRAGHDAFAGGRAVYRVCVVYSDEDAPNVIGPFSDLDTALASADRIPAGYAGMWIERAVWERVMSPVDEW